MEKYILPIILSLFLIYLFCFREKKRLIEGIGNDVAEGIVREELEVGGREVTIAEVREMIEHMDLTSMNDQELRILVQRHNETPLTSPESVRDALAGIRRENPSEGQATRANEAGTGGNPADDAGGSPGERSNADDAGGTPDQPAGGDRETGGQGERDAGGEDESDVLAESNPGEDDADVLSEVVENGEDSEVVSALSKDNRSAQRARRNYRKNKKKADDFVEDMGTDPDAEEILREEGYKVEEGRVKTSEGEELTVKQKRDLYQKYKKKRNGSYEVRDSFEGVEREVTEQIEGKLTRLKKFAKDHPYVALGLTAAGVILFNRESEEDCIETCTGSPDEDWKKAHKVESTYDNHCPEPDCQEFCSASGTGQCSVARRNAASAHEVLEEVTEDAEGLGGGVFDGIKEVFGDIFESIGLLPIAVCCGVMILSFLAVVVFNIIKSKATDKINTTLNSETVKNLKQIITPGGGGGIKNKLNSPKLIILFVFFIFIVYNGRRR